MSSRKTWGVAVYSGVPVGTVFTGAIDDVTAHGFITDGTTEISFSCCIAAGGLDLYNDMTVDAGTASLLNTIADSPIVNPGDKLDLIDIEGDELIAGGNRVEIGLSYILDPNAFDDDGLDNYPPDSEDILLALFFIVEEEDDGDGRQIYSALGSWAVPMEPAAVVFRGDCNADGGVDVADVICLVNVLFAGFNLLDRTSPELPCASDEGNVAGLDTSGNGTIDVADIVALASFLFVGPPLPEVMPCQVTEAEMGCPKNPACQ